MEDKSVKFAAIFGYNHEEPTKIMWFDSIHHLRVYLGACGEFEYCYFSEVGSEGLGLFNKYRNVVGSDFWREDTCDPQLGIIVFIDKDRVRST